MDEVTPWLVQQATKSAKTSSVPVIPERRVAKQASKQASRDLLQSPSGRPQRPQTAGEQHCTFTSSLHCSGMLMAGAAHMRIYHKLTTASLVISLAVVQAQKPNQGHLVPSTFGSTASGATLGRTAQATSPRTTAHQMACSSTAASVTTA